MIFTDKTCLRRLTSYIVSPGYIKLVCLL